jgi:excisionase family DNA binding protein
MIETNDQELSESPGPAAETAVAPSVQLLYTPAQAASLLSVPESTLRRQAAARTVPCTFVGKHLRFSPDDLTEIIAQGRRAARTTTGRRSGRTRRN